MNNLIFLFPSENKISGVFSTIWDISTCYFIFVSMHPPLLKNVARCVFRIVIQIHMYKNDKGIESLLPFLPNAISVVQHE